MDSRLRGNDLILIGITMINNRIENKFKELRARKKKAFIAFITAGDPNLKTTEELVVAFEKCGVDLVEIGVPFSDPLADGPTIQAASQRALQKKVTLKKILESVRKIRQRSEIPIALMTYYNPVLHFGEEKFTQSARDAGVDGVIIPDLPPEEAGSLLKSARKNNLAVIFFLSPTTTTERMKRIVKLSRGFIYYVSITGVTGARSHLPEEIKNNVQLAKRYTKTPICVGFGVSTAAQVKSVARVSDGVIVGSAIVNEIFRNAGKKDLVKNVARFVSRLAVILNPEGLKDL